MGSRVRAFRMARCAECRAPLSTAPIGRPRVYCSQSCKSKAKRRRAQIAAPWPPVAPPRYPADPAVVRRRTAEALVAALEGDPAAPPADQLAQALLDLGWIAYRLEALERDLPAGLAGPAAELGRLIRTGRARLFPTIEEAV